MMVVLNITLLLTSSFVVKVDSAKLTPIIDNGRIISVSVQNGGLGYVSGSTKIEVKMAGQDGSAELSLETGMSMSLKEILKTLMLMIVS